MIAWRMSFLFDYAFENLKMRYAEARMQQSESITFDPVQVHQPPLKTWHIALGIVLFACLIYGIIWRLRKR